ncbi:hypothetical protein OBBRIDRAFT_794561 [Obba rivulosa]|uniref:Uncharacterized protein n=1 Tax=Obba rivulosa TaxID=1052685 RepID=A0A8E2DJA3_9APHY|nr:hypothetical protein OBBRIDRAFT_794561 [Obba rivulosa]
MCGIIGGSQRYSVGPPGEEGLHGHSQTGEVPSSPPGEDNALLRPTEDSDEVALKAWETPHMGAAVEAFIRYILSFLGPKMGHSYTGLHRIDNYAKYVALCDSTGTGKSRTADELVKTRFTISMCFRRKTDTDLHPGILLYFNTLQQM